MAGFFLTLEGPEGSGKTTQIGRLAEFLRAAGLPVVATKEPGGTPTADRIRAILLDPRETNMDATTEVLLYAASRRQHVVEVIQPALETERIVICDRFTDATLAYQGFGRLLDLDRLRTLNEWATGGLQPDLTIIFDIPEEVGLRRAQARNDAAAELAEEGRFEAEDLRFHRRVREGYLALAIAEPGRFAIVDAAGSVDEVFDRLLRTLAQRAPQLPLPTRPAA
ncbi:MAG TPA: dTMP kinase [Thermoanaerobaculia bacterium]|nr:dTMP kinase [Thermoanaerobaculia bacterium]